MMTYPVDQAAWLGPFPRPDCRASVRSTSLSEAAAPSGQTLTSMSLAPVPGAKRSLDFTATIFEMAAFPWHSRRRHPTPSASGTGFPKHASACLAETDTISFSRLRSGPDDARSGGTDGALKQSARNWRGGFPTCQSRDCRALARRQPPTQRFVNASTPQSAATTTITQNGNRVWSQSVSTTRATAMPAWRKPQRI